MSLPDDPQKKFDEVEARLARYLDQIFGVDSLARQDFNSFYLSLLGMERNFVNLALNQVFEQIASGAETIDNPLQTGVISQLNYVEVTSLVCTDSLVTSLVTKLD